MNLVFYGKLKIIHCPHYELQHVSILIFKEQFFPIQKNYLLQCEGLAIHPFLLALPVTVATSYSFALPAATPPNTIVFAKGRVRVKHMVCLAFRY
ncbi:unnamed protein product [Schistosoma margrebowiei]|uniref:Uncharacterized protein n=1 Tax=Schistosoma margrebowiei TaxID=48269 RepID=A0A3P8HJY1_9TREM|nr:unnamed protein product [Schistosoma margrebowiei]